MPAVPWPAVPWPASASVEVRQVGVQAGGVGGAEVRRGRHRGSVLVTGVAAPARQEEGERGEQRQNRRERDEIDGEVEAMRTREREHRRSVLPDERTLDLRFGLSFVDQALDECALAIGLLGLRDV